MATFRFSVHVTLNERSLFGSILGFSPAYQVHDTLKSLRSDQKRHWYMKPKHKSARFWRLFDYDNCKVEKSSSKIILFVDYDALLLSQSTSGTPQKLSLQFHASIPQFHSVPSMCEQFSIRTHVKRSGELKQKEMKKSCWTQKLYFSGFFFGTWNQYNVGSMMYRWNYRLSPCLLSCLSLCPDASEHQILSLFRLYLNCSRHCLEKAIDWT